MEFDTNNNIIQLCMQGMGMEEKDQPVAAGKLLHQAWSNATNDFEKFIAAYYLARHQRTATDRLKWYDTALQYALKVNNDAVKGAYASLYLNIAECYASLGDFEKANKNKESATSAAHAPTDKGPFYHGTRADLQIGDFLTAGRGSNYQPELLMNHIYFTAMVNGAGLAAALAKGDGPERVYIVQPVGSFENDPNVTNKRFPGNPTRSYRTGEPLKITGEVTDWIRQTPEDLQKWRERLANNTGEIIN